MPTYRKPALALGVAATAAALTLAGTVATYASTTHESATSTSYNGVLPDPNAPHVGTVAGLQTGPHISIRNQQSVHAFRVLHQSLIAASKGASGDSIDTIHPSDGTSFNASDSGSQASQSVSLKIHVGNQGTTLYTPTTYPSAGGTPGSCIEMSTAYFYGKQVVAAWDWCKAINFVAEVKIDKAFMKTYTKKHYYSTQIIQTNASNNTWTSYLYNYKTKTWQQFFQQNGTGQIGAGYQGWDVYELYSELDGNGQSYACADLQGKRVAAKGIMVGVNGTLVPADSTNAGQAYDHPNSDFHCNSFSYNMINPLNHWKAIG
jgi:hypothetical protein